MKKIFILVPILALLVTGCSLAQKPVIDDSTSNQSASLSQEQANNLNAQVQDLKKQNSELVKENEAIKTNSANQNSNSSIVPNQTNTDWQTYNNKQYSYTIEYPSDWYVDTTYSEKDFSQRGPKENNEFIGGDTSFSNYKNLSSYNMDNPAPKDLYSVNLMIYKVDTNISYSQFVSSTHFGYDTKDNISINGISAVKLTGVSTDHPVGTTVINTLVKVGNKMFVFNYSGSPIPQQEKDIADKIISSFLTK